MQASMGPEGKFLLGVADTYNTRIVAGQGAGVISAELSGLQRKAEASLTGWLDTIREITPPNYKEMAPEIAQAIEDPAHVLSPEAAIFKAQYLDPALKQTDQMAKKLTSMTGQKVDWLQNYYPRNVVPKDNAAFVGITDVRVPTETKPVKISPGALQERTAGEVVDPATGQKGAYVHDERTGNVLVMSNKKVIDSGKQIENGIIKGGTGTQWQVSPGTMRNIEQHTNITYTKDPVADIAKAHSDVFIALANAQAVERLKVTPEFLTQARRPKQAAPSTWRDAADLNLGTHQLDGYKLSPHIQEVLNDYSKAGLSAGVSGLANLNRVIVGSLFINPLAHIMNVAWHGWVEKGLVSPGSVVGGGIGAAVGGPAGAVAGAAIGSLVNSPREVKALFTAIKAVSTHDENYMRYLKDGAGLMYASRFTRDFYNKALKMTGTAEAQPMIRAFGFGNAKDFIGSVYSGASNTMWYAGDIVMMQGYLANEARLGAAKGAGMTAQQMQRAAMTETEKHIPNYNVPSRIGPTALELMPGGAQVRRGMAQLMQGNLGILRFPRYDYGRIASYVNMMRDTIAGLHGAVTGAGGDRMASAQGALRGFNQMAAVGFGAMVMYPMLMDKVAQTITGNKNASWQRYGPFTVPALVYNYMKGNKADWETLAASMLPLGPLPVIATELLYNKDLFTGKSLNLPQGTFNYVMGQFAPVHDLQQIAAGKITPHQWLEQQFGIKDPTAAQLAKASAFFANEKKQHEKYVAGQ